MLNTITLIHIQLVFELQAIVINKWYGYKVF